MLLMKHNSEMHGTDNKLLHEGTAVMQYLSIAFIAYHLPYSVNKQKILGAFRFHVCYSVMKVPLFTKTISHLIEYCM